MRLLPLFMLALGLLALLIFLFFPRGAPPIAHAQSVTVATITSTHTSTTTTAAAAAAHSLYLPLIHKHGNIKRKSGLHLGNRGSDWRIELFSHITGTVTGTWPAAVVVLSSQLYSFTRPTTAATNNERCWITDAAVTSEDNVCITVFDDGDRRNNANYEQNWHEAYREDGGARTWFQRWWPLAE